MICMQHYNENSTGAEHFFSCSLLHPKCLEQCPEQLDEFKYSFQKQIISEIKLEPVKLHFYIPNVLKSFFLPLILKYLE